MEDQIQLHQINKTIETLKIQFQEMRKEMKDYFRNKHQEEFVDNLSIDEEKLLLQGETILDRKMKEKERIDKVTDLQNDIQFSLHLIETELKKTTTVTIEDDRNVIQSINKTIDLLKQIRQRKADKEKIEKPKRKRTIQGQCDDDNEEMEDTWKDYKSEREMNVKRRTIEMNVRQVTERNINSLLFDSNVHKWSINDSEFGEKVKNHKNVAVIIEDKENNIFGGYCSKVIGINKYHFDSNGFLFSIKRNGEETLKKYPLKDGYKDFKIFSDNSDLLFVFGAQDKDNSCYFKDIVIQKKDSEKKNYCQQSSYEYNGEENVFRNNSSLFNVERILVYEMEESEQIEQTEQHKQQQKQTQNQKKVPEEPNNEIEQKLYELTNKHTSEILFDSDRDKWSKKDSEFRKNISRKNNIIVLVEDTKNNVFGGYIGNNVNIKSKSKDPTCYLFSLKKDGKYTMKTYKRNTNGNSYWLPSNREDVLIAFGMNNHSCEDLTLYKKDFSTGYCDQFCFDYQNEENALVPNRDFIIKRIIVYQMIDIMEIE